MNTEFSPDNPLFILAVLLAFGALCGQLARRVHLPSVTGQILAGVILGPSVMGVFGHEAANSLTPIVHFALGLIAVDIGTHLHLRRLRNSFQRLGILLLLEATAIPLFVYLALVFGARTDWTVGALFGALAIATAPATVLSIVKETRSKGVYVRTLIAAVALNNIACITLFEMAYSAVGITLDPVGGGTGNSVLLAPLIQLGGSLVLGVVVGSALLFATRHVHKVEQLTTVSIIALFLTSGAADLLGLSNLLSCLFLGVTMVNLAPEKEEIGHRVFANFEPAVLAIFFTLAGLDLNFGFLASGWPLVALFVFSRIVGKIVAGFLAMRMAGATENVRRFLGLGLIPQAGVAVGLLLQIRDNPLFDSMSQMILAVGVTAVAVNEIIGPITTRVALAHSGDLGKDRPRLIDFIHEENIATDFQAESKEEALGKLVDLLISSHGLQIDRQEFLEGVLAREKVMSTCIGRGLAVPHGNLAAGENFVGAMAVSRRGLDFGTPDGMPLRCLVLLAVPPEEKGRHLEVQAVLARAIGGNWSLQIQLYNSQSPAHVYEILHAEEFEDFNYFLQAPVETKS
ncbi:MAG: cation:proton antiporter [Gemmatimonadales bacterium]|nr:cation:proton antiporter [Gemmatimonadales bacterium]